MCYMTRPEQVGVRELRQNLSVYLQRVKRGETLVVTERGKPVARLTPAVGDSVLDRMIADGRVRPATRNWEDLPPPRPRRPGEPTLTEVLLAMRDEEDR